MNALKWAWARLQEPSTWGGIAVLLHIAAPLVGIAGAPYIAAAVAVVAVAKKETGG